MLDREGAEASQLHSLSAGKRERYFFEDRGDDGLYILAAQMRISRRQLRDQFRFCQGFPRGQLPGRCQMAQAPSILRLCEISVFQTPSTITPS